MARVFDSETGATREVSEDEARQGFLAGRFGFIGDRVNLIGADGSAFNVAPNEAAQAFEAGARIATDQEVAVEKERARLSTPGQAAIAHLEAAGRGLSLGALTPLEVAAGVDPEAIKGRREVNPGTLATEVVASAATVPLTGGAGALGLGARGVGALARAGQAARVAGALPRATAALGRAAEAGVRGALGARGSTVAGRGLAAGAAGAVEGAVVGTGQVLSEAALGDIDLTAEQVLAGAARGAVFGGAASGLLTGTAVATGKAFKTAARKALSADAIEKVADRAAFRQFNPLQAHVRAAQRQFGRDPGPVIGRVVREEGVDVFGQSPDEILDVVTAKKQQWGKAVGDVVEELDGRVDDTVKPELKTIAARLRKEVIDPLKRSSSKTARQLGKRVEDELSSFDPFGDSVPTKLPSAAVRGRQARARTREPARDPLTNVSPREAGAGALLTGEIRSAGHVARRARSAGDLGPMLTGRAPRQIGFADLHRMRRELDVVAYPQRTPGSPPPAPSPFQAELIKARGVIESELEKAADIAAEAAGDSVNATYRAAKEKYSVFSTLHTISTKNVERDVANRTISLTDTIAGAGGMPAGAIVGLLAGDVSVLGGLAVGALTGVATGAVNKLVREQGRKLAATAGSKLIAIRNTSDDIARRLEAAAGSFVDKASTTSAIGTAKAAVSAASGSVAGRRKEFDQRLADLESNLDGSQDMLGLEDEAPQTAAAVQQAMVRAKTFVAQKAPRLPKLQGVKLEPSRVVPPQAQSKFLRYARAADDFATVIQDLAEGRITPEAVEAANAVYPKSFEKLKVSVSTALSRQDVSKMPAARRVQLSLVLGRPVHFSLEPDFIRATQAAIASAGPEAREGAVSPSRRSAPDTSDIERTRTDAMESA